jgi:hypothetical protein
VDLYIHSPIRLHGVVLNYLRTGTTLPFTFTFIIMALQPFAGPWPLFQFLDPIHSREDSLDGGSDRRKAATYTQNNRNTE